MAIVRNNPLTQGLSGSIGNLVFKQYKGRTLVGIKRRPKNQSELQRENRSRFKHAAAWAKSQMLITEKKAYYQHKARKLKLPNAYTAAVSDYMRKGDIKEIDTRQYKGKTGNVIRMKIWKKDFAVHQVKVVLLYENGIVIESDVAVKKDQDVFVYKVTQNVSERTPVTIRVILPEHYDNIIKREVKVVI